MLQSIVTGRKDGECMDSKELSFVVYLLYQLSEAWNMIPSRVYAKLKEADIISDYILPCYDTLHTLGSQYLVEDLTSLARERGVTI